MAFEQICSREDRPRLESENAVRQLEYIAARVVDYRQQEIREADITTLHSIAVAGIWPCGGSYRDLTRDVEIQNSPHKVPEVAAVSGLVREAVHWLEQLRMERAAFTRAAYALWRINWIHPFSGGNGRTARATCYMILCMATGGGAMLPGTVTLPSLIYERREECTAILRRLDAAHDPARRADLTELERFLEECLTQQVVRALAALSRPPPKPSP